MSDLKDNPDNYILSSVAPGDSRSQYAFEQGVKATALGAGLTITKVDMIKEPEFFTDAIEMTRKTVAEHNMGVDNTNPEECTFDYVIKHNGIVRPKPQVLTVYKVEKKLCQTH